MIRRRTIATPAGPFAIPRMADRPARYFAGDPEVDLDDVPTPQGPAFARRCWEACRAIPRGETRTYGEIARGAGSGVGAARAVGQAMKRNPLELELERKR